MTDERLQPASVPPDPAILASLTHVGGTFTVAGHDGVCVELRTRVVQGDVVVASVACAPPAAGARLSARAYDGTRAWTLVFAVEAVDGTAAGRSDVLLRLVRTVDRGDERGDRRLVTDAPGTATAVEAADGPPARRPAPITVVETSRSGLAFVAARRLEADTTVDLAFEDDGGATIRVRATILRVERAVYSRTRCAVRLTAVGELDQLRLDRMLSRADVAPDPRTKRSADGARPAGAPSPERRHGPWRRLLGRG